jgi:alanine racemase
MFGRLMRSVREWRRRLKGSEPVIRVEISKSALLHNLAELKRLAPQWGVAPVLKANAYGHGLVEVADILEREQNVPFFGIDSYFEAELLRANGIGKPLLILGYTHTKTIVWNTWDNVAFTVGSMEQLNELQKLRVTQKVQIKFDTGMHRQGVPWHALPEVVGILRTTTLQVEGICSHFAESETPGSELTKKQIQRWNDIVRRFQSEFPAIKHYHIANSGGFGHAHDVVANVGRSGIALYGINPGNLRATLRPALRMVSVVSAVRTIEAGEHVGYNATFTAEKRMTLATVPVGFFEGVDRRLSNQGVFLVSGKPAPIRGRVSMNISSCDVSGIQNVSLNSEVVVISNKPEDPNSVAAIAKLCGTIHYEILVHIPAHLRRVVIE